MPTRVTRRQFVATAAATFSAPTIIRASALGRGDRPAPSERITVAMIGCGKQGKDYHISTLTRLADAQLVGVCEVDQTRREYSKERIDKANKVDSPAKGCFQTDDFREVLARDDVDAVCIATPDHWHTIPILEACKAGKDIYCEKPLTLTLTESKRCIEAVNKHKVVFQTGSQQRSSAMGQFRYACELVRNGRLGKIKSITVGVAGPSRWCDLPEEDMEPGLNWDMWLGQAPTRPYSSVLSPRGVHNHFPSWRAYREYSGGGHSDMGAHHYDIAQWALDMDDSGPVEIIPPDNPKSGRGVKFIYENGIEMTHGGPQGCVFTGTEGTMHIGRGVLTSDPEDIVKQPIGDNEIHLFDSPGHHRNWLDCIKTREKCVAPVEAGARTVAIVHLGNLAYWYERSLKWDPKNWRFVDDDQANAEFLDRSRRDPWQLPEV